MKISFPFPKLFIALRLLVVLSVLSGLFGWKVSQVSATHIDAAGRQGAVSPALLSPVIKNGCFTSISVTSLDDSGPGTLRQAINDICDGGTITFDASLSGLTILTTTQLAIAKSLTIDGSALASQVSINVDNYDRVFSVGSGVDVTLDSLKIKHGNISGNGAGIYNQGTLAVANCTLLNNNASLGGGIYNDGGSLTVTDSLFSINSAAYDGGAIYNKNGTVTVTDSTLSENSAPSGGGGILNYGTLAITDSTLSANTSSGSYGGGGGINIQTGTATVTTSTLSGNSTGSSGGAIVNFATLTVINSTIQGNSASQGGGIHNGGGATLTVLNSTLSGNSGPNGGGGMFNANGTLNYANTIIAGSTSGGDCVLLGTGSVGTNLNNLVQDGSCSASLSGDPKLSALADNGGPTRTMALQYDSPAVDAGDKDICEDPPVNNLDQRGVTRPQGLHCDIGAYELHPVAIIFLPLVFRQP